MSKGALGGGGVGAGGFESGNPDGKADDEIGVATFGAGGGGGGEGGRGGGGVAIDVEEVVLEVDLDAIATAMVKLAAVGGDVTLAEEVAELISVEFGGGDELCNGTTV